MMMRNSKKLGKKLDIRVVLKFDTTILKSTVKI